MKLEKWENSLRTIGEVQQIRSGKNLTLILTSPTDSEV